VAVAEVTMGEVQPLQVELAVVVLVVKIQHQMEWTELLTQVVVAVVVEEMEEEVMYMVAMEEVVLLF
jgi:hypothetical protein